MNSSEANQSKTPSKWLDKLLRWLIAPHLREEVLGDLHERYSLRVQRLGQAKARSAYWREVLAYLRPSIIKRKPSDFSSPSFFHPDMLRNYFKIAVRNLLRYPGFSFINILGLAIGLAVCMVISLFIQQELRYDRHHQKADRIYRITADLITQGKTSPLSVTPAPWAAALTSDFPQVLKAVRLLKDKKSSVGFKEKHFYENRLFLSDSSVFEVFTLPF